MRKILFMLTIGFFGGVALLAQQSSAPNSLLKIALAQSGAGNQTDSHHAMSAKYEDLQWQSMVPDLGADSPQISDPARRSGNARNAALDSNSQATARAFPLALRERNTHDYSRFLDFRARRKARTTRPRRIQLHPGQNAAPGLGQR